MDYFTRRNAAILALTQMGVIVAGVLAAGVTHKWFKTLDIPISAKTTFLADKGPVALVVPVLWLGWALLALRSEAPNTPAGLVFVSGIGLLLLLLVWVMAAGVLPLFSLRARYAVRTRVQGLGRLSPPLQPGSGLGRRG